MVKKVKVNVVGSGVKGDPYRVKLPTYSMVGGSEVFKAGKLVSVEVYVPDDECVFGVLDEVMVRKKYRNNLVWDKEGVLDNVVVEAVKVVP